MAKAYISKENVDDLIENIDKGTVDITTVYNNWAQKIIQVMALRNVPFKVYNLGAGVKRITMDTDTCPCCKRKL